MNYEVSRRGTKQSGGKGDVPSFSRIKLLKGRLKKKSNGNILLNALCFYSTPVLNREVHKFFFILPKVRLI